MKNYLKEIILLLMQLFIFYIFPMFAGPTDAIGMVILIILITFILSIILGIISNNKIRFIFPFIVVIIFIPSIFIYYNSSALIHLVWYLLVSTIGLIIGIIFKYLINKVKNNLKL